MVKKVVIPANNGAKATAFFDEINRKKGEARKKLEAKTSYLIELMRKANITKR